jgi:hypothetical protein
VKASKMNSVSYSDLFSLNLDRGYDEDIFAGDVVRMGQNLYPHFEVIAVSGDKIWVRNLQSGEDHIGLACRARKIDGEPVQMAA